MCVCTHIYMYICFIFLLQNGYRFLLTKRKFQPPSPPLVRLFDNLRDSLPVNLNTEKAIWKMYVNDKTEKQEDLPFPSKLIL